MTEQDVLKKAKKLAKKSGLTYQQIGERMSYPPESARQSAWQFLNGKNPSVKMLLKFAEAIKVDVENLL